MPDPAQTDPRPPAADGERALPEEIASAIEALVNAIGYAASDDGVFLEDMNCDEARSALTTSILSRLTAAEAGREEAESGNDRLAIEAARLEIQRDAALARVEKLEKALKPFADVCDADHMRYVKDEQVLELSTRAEVPVSEKLRGRDFRAARSALTEAQPKGAQ